MKVRVTRVHGGKQHALKDAPPGRFKQAKFGTFVHGSRYHRTTNPGKTDADRVVFRTVAGNVTWPVRCPAAAGGTSTARPTATKLRVRVPSHMARENLRFVASSI